jgi:hypothetical protein
MNPMASSWLQATFAAILAWGGEQPLKVRGMLLTMELIALRLIGVPDLKTGAGTYSRLVRNISGSEISPMEPPWRMSSSFQNNP